MTPDLHLPFRHLPLTMILVAFVGMSVVGIGDGIRPSRGNLRAQMTAAAPKAAAWAVYLHRALGDGTSLQLYGNGVAPAAGRLGPFSSWLRPAIAVTDARVVIDGPTGEQVVVRARRCRLSDDGQELTFDEHVCWYRGDLERVVHSNQITVDLDRRTVTFGRGAYLEDPKDTAWTPFTLKGFFAPFPRPAAAPPQMGADGLPATSSRTDTGASVHLIAQGNPAPRRRRSS